MKQTQKLLLSPPLLFSFVDSNNREKMNKLPSVLKVEQWSPILSPNSRAPRMYWQQDQNQRKYFEWIAEQLHIVHPEDWFKFTKAQLFQFPHVSTILSYHEFSLSKALRVMFPEKEWNEVAWKRVPRFHWKNKTNQRQLFDWIAERLQIRVTDDWYKVTTAQLMSFPHSKTILLSYGNSLCNTLKGVYEELDWKPWKFSKAPRNMWKEKSVSLNCFEELQSALHIFNPSDWKTVPRVKIRDLLKRYNMLLWFNRNFTQMIQALYPNVTDTNSPIIHMSEIESQTLNSLKTLFPNEQILQFQQFSFGELDFYIPSLGLAFEVQGEHHYSAHYFGTSHYRTLKDRRKKHKCSEAGITLIQIGYWWDSSLVSLKNKIQQHRPDLISIL